jgi:hypothetical protein
MSISFKITLPAKQQQHRTAITVQQLEPVSLLFHSHRRNFGQIHFEARPVGSSPFSQLRPKAFSKKRNTSCVKKLKFNLFDSQI